ncbi:MAG: hypothetical protein K9J38_01210 [Polynucleobacter sp.]|nr:hypothetical protein [Polynucleobacter sp.]
MKIFIFLFLGFNLIFANAGILDNKISLYTCPKNQYVKCNDCKKNGMKIDFLLNKNDKTIMARVYFEGNSQSVIYENCKIFDEKNWDCSTKNSFEGKFAINTQESIYKMTNGVFQSILVWNTFSDKVITEVQSHSCAK